MSQTQQVEDKKLKFLSVVREVHGNIETITRPQIQALVKDHGCPDPTWLWRSQEHRLGNGLYRIPTELMDIPTPMKSPIPFPNPNLQGVEDVGQSEYAKEKITFDNNYAAVVPEEDPLYVPFGNYFDVETITISRKFFPYWIYGLSGNGKTLGVEQAHARNKQRLVNVPITREADEDSLLGGLRLEGGSTVPFYGPVTLAALLGVTCLLDETDLGDEKLMCLQTALQNRPFLIKRLGKMIYPKTGFNICATANTKGQGSEDGKFVGTNIMNEAMLDRYVVLFEQDYPGSDVEKQILHKLLKSYGHTTTSEEHFVDRLTTWAEKIRTTYKSGATSEIITTRRLAHICRAYDMFGKDRKKAVTSTLSRFNETVKSSFLGFYEAIDEDCNKREAEQQRAAAARAKGNDDESLF